MSDTANASTPERLASSLGEEISTRRQTRLDQEAHRAPFKPRRHYASSLNGCARQLVYARIAWQDKAPFSAEGVATMHDGIHEEKLLLAELAEDGFEVVEQQVGLDDDRYDVTGKIDGKIKWEGRRIPFEIKRLKPFVFDRIESIADFEGDPFLLKYKRQLTLYLLLHNEPEGLFILSDGLGKRKVIVVPLDYELGEAILKDLDAANAALRIMQEQAATRLVSETAYPPRIPYGKTCQYCPYRNVCLPDQHAGEGAQMADSALAERIAEYAALKPQVARMETLKQQIKQAVEGKELLLAGTYLVTGKWQERTVKAQAARTDKWWKWEVEELAPSPKTET